MIPDLTFVDDPISLRLREPIYTVLAYSEGVNDELIAHNLAEWSNRRAPGATPINQLEESICMEDFFPEE